MFGIFIILMVIAGVLVCDDSYVRPEDIEETTCTVTGLNVTSKYTIVMPWISRIKYDYTVTLETDDRCFYEGRTRENLWQLTHDHGLINRSFICYRVRDEIMLWEPKTCDKHCSDEICLSWLCILISIGIIMEFWAYKPY